MNDKPLKALLEKEKSRIFLNQILRFLMSEEKCILKETQLKLTTGLFQAILTLETLSQQKKEMTDELFYRYLKMENRILLQINALGFTLRCKMCLKKLHLLSRSLISIFKASSSIKDYDLYIKSVQQWKLGNDAKEKYSGVQLMDVFK